MPQPLTASRRPHTAGPRKFKALFVGTAALAALTLSACAPNLGPLPTPVAPSAIKSDVSLAAPASDWPGDGWWTAYNDPVLDGLIDEGLKGAPSVREAAARLRIAQAAAGQARAVTLPSFNSSASVQEYLQSKNIGFPPFIQPLLPSSFHPEGRITADFAYDLDLFGKNRATLAAASSDAMAAEADVGQARLTLSTAIAAAYADLRRLMADRKAAVDAVEVRKKTLSLVAQRLDNGLETRGEFKQQAAAVPTAQGEVDQLDRQIGLARNQLAALLGAGPDRGLSISIPDATPALHPFGLPENLPANLIGRRPDIVAARLRAEAAGKRIKAAKADFYPDVNLSATYGYQSLGLDTLFDKASRTGQFGPALRLPIFNGGIAGANLNAAYGRYQQAVANYDQTLTLAVKDVADAAVSIRTLDRQLADAREALANGEDAYRIAVARYQGGLSPYLNVLTSENALIAQRRAVADLEGLAFTYDVSLVRALGGGYMETQPAKVAKR